MDHELLSPTGPFHADPPSDDTDPQSGDDGAKGGRDGEVVPEQRD